MVGDGMSRREFLAWPLRYIQQGYERPVEPAQYVTVDIFVTMERWQNHRLDVLEWRFLQPGPHEEKPRAT